MKSSFRKISSGIVPRLRFTFYVIAMVLFAQMCVGIWHLRTVNTAGSDLTQKAVGTLVLVEASQRDLKKVLLLLQQANTTTSVSTLVALRTQLDQTLKDLDFSITAMVNSNVINANDAQLIEAFRRIETDSKQVIAAQTTSASHARNITNLTAELDRIHTSTRSILETLSYDALQRNDTALRRITTNMSIGASDLHSEISNEFALANTLTTLTLEMDTIFDKAGTLGRLTKPKIVDIQQQELRREIRELVILVGQLPETQTRLKLARALQQLRKLLFGPQGYVEEVAARAAQIDQQSSILSGQNEPIDIISTALANQNVRANSHVETATNDLAYATNTLVSTLLLTTLASLLVIAITNFYVVERQINNRMGRLTKAVVSIAKGDTDYVVNIKGPDELGKIAKALEVFRVNATELSRSNSELETFAYAAAHDLRSPLRAIQDLLDWIKEDDENRFSQDSAQNIALLQNRIERLNHLLSDLLEYSRVGQEEKDIIELHIEQIVCEVADVLDPENRYDIRYMGEKMPVQTYATPLRQILLNLISNGIKHHDHEHGKITVNAHVESGRIHISVKDDGPGVPKTYHDRIFGMFETLRPRDEVEGSGLGLSIIRKSLDRYEGQIEIVSDPSKKRGTSFHFDLPECSSSYPALKNVA